MRNSAQIVFTFVGVAVIFSFLAISQQMDLAEMSSSYLDAMKNRELVVNGSKIPSIGVQRIQKDSITDSLSYIFGFNNPSKNYNKSSNQGALLTITAFFGSEGSNDFLIITASSNSSTIDQAIDFNEIPSTTKSVVNVKVSLVYCCLITRTRWKY